MFDGYLFMTIVYRLGLGGRHAPLLHPLGSATDLYHYLLLSLRGCMGDSTGLKISLEGNIRNSFIHRNGPCFSLKSENPSNKNLVRAIILQNQYAPEVRSKKTKGFVCSLVKGEHG